MQSSNYRNIYKQVPLFNAFAAAKRQSEKVENGIANQDHFDLQFSIGARVRALALARAGAQAWASRRSINPP